MLESSLAARDIPDEKTGTDPFLSYYHLIAQTPFAIVLLRGQEMRIETANEAALELWGKQREEVLHKTLEQAFPELLTQGFVEILQSVYTTGKRFASNEQPIT